MAQRGVAHPPFSDLPLQVIIHHSQSRKVSQRLALGGKYEKSKNDEASPYQKRNGQVKPSREEAVHYVYLHAARSEFASKMPYVCRQ